MKLLAGVPSLENGYGFAGFIGGRAAHSLTRSSYLVLVALRIPHRGRDYVVHVQRNIVIFDRHPEFAIASYGGPADLYVEYVVRESTSSDVI